MNPQQIDPRMLAMILQQQQGQGQNLLPMAPPDAPPQPPVQNLLPMAPPPGPPMPGPNNLLPMAPGTAGGAPMMGGPRY